MSSQPLGSLILVLAGYLCFMIASYLLFFKDMLETVIAIDRDSIVRSYVAREVADGILVLGLLVLVPRPVRHFPTRRWLAWPVALLVLPVVLALNFGYAYTMRALVEGAGIPIPEIVDITLDYGVWAIILVCVQPALIEELFFRHLMLGHLRPHVGMHGAVWVSAGAFALAHVGRGAVWPLLILVGGFLGYARVRSGGLWLPMLLHFLHNLAVLWVAEQYNL